MTTTFDAALAASPLLEIERRVQDRAKRTGLHDQSAEALRAMLVDEVDRWNVDFQRGIRRRQSQTLRASSTALRNLSGYGPWRRSSSMTTSGRSRSTLLTRSSSSGTRVRAGSTTRCSTTTITCSARSRLLDDAPGAHRKLDPAEGLQDARSTGSRAHRPR
jgi:hypothetical protein